MIIFSWDRTEKWRRFRRVAVLCLFLLVMLGVGYVNSPYPADERARSYMQGGDGVTVTETEKGWYFDGSGEETAFIFYPGALVESTAYAPLLYSLAEQGVDCFLLDMPCCLAIFGTDYAGDVMEAYTYENWYLGGHSLGGAMASVYAGEHPEQLKGIVFLAAYAEADISESGLSALVIYGSEDRVMSRARLEDRRRYLAQGYREVCIEGGNHAQFGGYGKQAGDGGAKISPTEQTMQTVEAILEFLEAQ